MNNNLFNDDLEFHYVVSCRDGKWSMATDVENSVMSDGTIYDYGKHEWLFGSDELEALDIAYYSVLSSMLRQMNGEPNA